MNDKHEELKRHMEAAFNHLSKIPVSGMAVDQMAMARQELRIAFAALQSLDSEEDHQDTK